MGKHENWRNAQQALRQRREALGLKRIEVWVHESDKKIVRDFVATLEAHRELEKAT